MTRTEASKATYCAIVTCLNFKAAAAPVSTLIILRTDRRRQRANHKLIASIWRFFFPSHSFSRRTPGLMGEKKSQVCLCVGCGVFLAFVITEGLKDDGLLKTLIVRNQC